MNFRFDVFLSHSSKDKAIVHTLAERVLACSVVAPERGRMLCASANAFGSDWAQLHRLSQPSTLNPQPTSAPLNKERRFLPLRLDDAPIKGSLMQPSEMANVCDGSIL